MKKHSILFSLFILIVQISFSQIEAKKQITLEDIWKKGAFAQKREAGFTSMEDGKHYSLLFADSKTSKNYLLKYEYSTGKVVDTLLKPSELSIIENGNTKLIALDDYEFNGTDEQKIIIPTEVSSIYRRSTEAENYIFDRKTKKTSRLSSNGKQRNASFSPDGKKVAFVRDNNLFLIDLGSGLETQLTTDGKKNEIINGVCDWVYEEEFGFAKAFFWAGDSESIAFYKFDEKEVKEFEMSTYGDLYPSIERFKYPKAGEKNSVISIHTFNLSSKKTIEMEIGAEKDQYIPRIKWTTDASKLCIQRMNRLQNKLEYLIADRTSGKSTILLIETDKAYIDITDDLTFLKNGKEFIISSEKDGFNHIYLYSMDGKLKKQLTKGAKEVTNFYGVDEKSGLIYYQMPETSPMNRAIYSTSLDGKKTVQLTKEKGTNDAKFSNDFSFFVHSYSNANTPLTVTLNDRSGKMVRVLEDNKVLKGRLKEYQMQTKEFFSFTTSENVQLNAWMLKPQNFNASKKYPVYMFLYGGPGSQEVLDKWGGANLIWYEYLASKGYLVVCVDNRGTGGRGADFKKCTYMNLGGLETIDQIEAAKWLGKQTYVDASRIGIQGWSYGGYMSSLCITKGADVFKMAIAVAPVTNWKFYDSIYTERYLRTPKENSKGYEENSPLNFTNLLKGNYLLIHGTSDDNVHFQNSVEMIKSMISADRNFDSEIYPNKNHGISGGNTRFQLYSKMTNFVFQNL